MAAERAPEHAKLDRTSLYTILANYGRVVEWREGDRDHPTEAAVVAATDKAYAAGVAEAPAAATTEAEAKEEHAWQDGYDHGQGHERAATAGLGAGKPKRLTDEAIGHILRINFDLARPFVKADLRLVADAAARVAHDAQEAKIRALVDALQNINTVSDAEVEAALRPFQGDEGE